MCILGCTLSHGAKQHMVDIRQLQVRPQKDHNTAPPEAGFLPAIMEAKHLLKICSY